MENNNNNKTKTQPWKHQKETGWVPDFPCGVPLTSVTVQDYTSSLWYFFFSFFLTASSSFCVRMSRQYSPSLITTSLQASYLSSDSYHPAASTRHDNRVHIYLLWHFVCQNLWFLPFFNFFFFLCTYKKYCVCVVVVISLPLALVGLPPHFHSHNQWIWNMRQHYKMGQQNHGRANQTKSSPLRRPLKNAEMSIRCMMSPSAQRSNRKQAKSKRKQHARAHIYTHTHAQNNNN